MLCFRNTSVAFTEVLVYPLFLLIITVMGLFFAKSVLCCLQKRDGLLKGPFEGKWFCVTDQTGTWRSYKCNSSYELMTRAFTVAIIPLPAHVTGRLAPLLGTRKVSASKFYMWFHRRFTVELQERRNFEHDLFYMALSSVASTGSCRLKLYGVDL
jgi:hypothetical protein